MNEDELRETFDQQAAGYDRQWTKMAPIRDALHYLLPPQFAGLPDDASLLCVGAGTGAELAFLAERFPRWRFTAVEPSGRMLDECRRRAERDGFASRCEFHEGYLDSLPPGNKHDAATSFLVSQFLLDPASRSGFFRQIADRLKPGGLLASSDLASDVGSDAYETLLASWIRMMSDGDIPPDGIERMRRAYAKDVAIVPPAAVASVIVSGGFGSSTLFFQAGLIHAWISETAA